MVLYFLGFLRSFFLILVSAFSKWSLLSDFTGLLWQKKFSPINSVWFLDMSNGNVLGILPDITVYFMARELLEQGGCGYRVVPLAKNSWTVVCQMLSSTITWILWSGFRKGQNWLVYSAVGGTMNWLL